MTNFGVRHRFDAALSLSVPDGLAGTRERIEQILHRFTDRAVLTSERLGGDSRSILSYRVLLRDPSRRTELREALATAGDIRELSFYLQNDESEL